MSWLLRRAVPSHWSAALPVTVNARSSGILSVCLRPPEVSVTVQPVTYVGALEIRPRRSLCAPPGPHRFQRRAPVRPPWPRARDRAIHHQHMATPRSATKPIPERRPWTRPATGIHCRLNPWWNTRDLPDLTTVLQCANRAILISTQHQRLHVVSHLLWGSAPEPQVGGFFMCVAAPDISGLDHT